LASKFYNVEVTNLKVQFSVKCLKTILRSRQTLQ